jgi:hypothetical protein
MRWGTRAEVGVRFGKYRHVENLGDGCTGHVLQKWKVQDFLLYSSSLFSIYVIFFSSDKSLWAQGKEISTNGRTETRSGVTETDGTWVEQEHRLKVEVCWLHFGTVKHNWQQCFRVVNTHKWTHIGQTQLAAVLKSCQHPQMKSHRTNTIGISASELSTPTNEIT